MPRLFARGFGREAAQQRHQRLDVARRHARRSGSARARSCGACSRAAPPGSREQAVFVHRRDRLAERRIGRSRQPGTLVDAPKPAPRAVVHQRAHARSGRPASSASASSNSVDIAGQQRAQDQAGGELAGLAQMPDQRRPRRAAIRPRASTVAFSQASLAMRCARSSSSQSRATTKPASVSDSLATSAWRVAAGRSGRASSVFADRARDGRSARRCGRARTARSRRRDFRAASGRLRREPTSAMAAATERGSMRAPRDRGLRVARPPIAT